MPTAAVIRVEVGAQAGRRRPGKNERRRAIEPSGPALMLPSMAAPPEIAWERLSPRGKEIMRQVVLRLAAGYTYTEIAQILDRDRPPFKHLVPPVGRIDKSWVSTRTRELKREIEDMMSPVA